MAAAHPAILLWGARGIAALFGFGLTCAVGGYVSLFQSIFGPGGGVGLLVAAVVTACAAAGPSAARRGAVVALRSAPRSAGGVGARGGVESDLPWLLQSILGGVLGVLLIVGLGCSAGVRSAWAALSLRFFWVGPVEDVYVAAMVAATIGLVGAVAGLQVVSLFMTAVRGAQLVAPRRSGAGAGGAFSPVTRAAGVTVGVFAGIALAVAAGDAFSAPGLSAEQWILLGAAVMFGVSVASVALTRRIETATADENAIEIDDFMPSESPQSTESQTLLVASAIAIGAALSLWVGAAAMLQHEASFAGRASSFAWDFGAVAIGAAIADWHAGRRKYSVGGFGVAMWLVGATALATAAVHAVATAEASSSWIAWAFDRLPAACFGHALPYGRGAFVRRFGEGRPALSRWVTGTLAGVAVGAAGLEALRPLPPAGSAPAALACLLLLVCGGLMQIHERHGIRRVRVQRLVLVFVSLAAAVVVLPAAARRAALRRDETRRSERAAASAVTAATAPRDDRWRWSELLGGEASLAGAEARVLSIGDEPLPASVPPFRLACVPWNAGAIVDDIGSGSTPAQRRGAASWGTADRWWRYDRQRYDVIVQRSAGLSDADLPARWSWEWLVRLRDRLSPDGLVLVELPMMRLDAAAVHAVTRTFDGAFARRERCIIFVDDDAHPAAYLLAVPPGSTTLVSAIRAHGDATRSTRPSADDPFGTPLNTIRSPAFRAGKQPTAPSAKLADLFLPLSDVDAIAAPP